MFATRLSTARRASKAPSSTSRSSPARAEKRTNATRPSDRKSTRLNSSHSQISYAVFCLKKNKHLTNQRSLGQRCRPLTTVTSVQPSCRQHQRNSVGRSAHSNLRAGSTSHPLCRQVLPRL